MKKLLSLLVFSLCFNILNNQAHAYPLDGFDETNINRLEGYFHSLPTKTSKKDLEIGAMLSVTEIGLSTQSANQFKYDIQLSSKLKSILDEVGASNASLSFIDISKPADIRYAGHNDNRVFVPGSVGKIFVTAALFDTLRELYPNSIQTRRKILFEKQITATNFVEGDSHEVPFWDQKTRKIYHRNLIIGDTANIWTYLDWMISASSNAAASMIMREIVLMRHFGNRYPVSPAEEINFLATASKPELSQLMRSSFLKNFIPASHGPNYQGSTFTKQAKLILPGVGSSSTPKSLATFLLALEQGKIIDLFSSLEIKRLLYSTQKRVRYADIPELNTSAVYFKSGSLYSCMYEKHFQCGKYMGNVKNLLNAAVLIESPAENPIYSYILVLSTDILRRNSEELHKTIAAKVHNLITKN